MNGSSYLNPSVSTLKKISQNSQALLQAKHRLVLKSTCLYIIMGSKFGYDIQALQMQAF